MRVCGKFSLCRLGMVLAAASVLAACTKGGQFDPTTLLDNDMFDSKKPITGQREPVFPGGVPGATTGIPEDLYKGYQPPPEQAADTGGAATPILPPGEEPAKPTATAAAEPEAKPKPKPKTKVARKPAHPRTKISIGLSKRPNEAAQSSSPASQTAWPAPPAAGQAQSSQSAWPAPPSNSQAQSSQSVWPAPPSGGTQQAAQPSQSIWPNPPPTGGSQ
jgi:hypothetical protein